MPPLVTDEMPYQEFTQELKVGAYHRAAYTAMVVLRGEVSTFKVNEIEARFRRLALIMLGHAACVNDFSRDALREGSHRIHNALLAEFEDSISLASVTEI